MWAVKRETKLGDPASDITEYQELGIDGFVKANNRRRAGRMRIAELLTPHPDRSFPSWHPRYGEQGAPKLYVIAARCPELVEQLKSAPLLPIDASKGRGGDRQTGLGITIRPFDCCPALRVHQPTGATDDDPETEALDDPRAEALRQTYVRERERSEEMEFEQVPRTACRKGGRDSAPWGRRGMRARGTTRGRGRSRQTPRER